MYQCLTDMGSEAKSQRKRRTTTERLSSSLQSNRKFSRDESQLFQNPLWVSWVESLSNIDNLLFEHARSRNCDDEALIWFIIKLNQQRRNDGAHTAGWQK